jgi:hypothetical protein
MLSIIYRVVLDKKRKKSDLTIEFINVFALQAREPGIARVPLQPIKRMKSCR